MKQFWIKLLLLVLLVKAFAPPAVHDFLVKIPALIQHFQAHMAEHPEMSVMAFIDQHYGQAAAEHSDDHDHSSLPLKSDHHPNNHCHCLMAALVPFPLEFWLSSPALLVKDKSPFAHNAMPPSSIANSIFQPPRKG